MPTDSPPTPTRGGAPDGGAQEDEESGYLDEQEVGSFPASDPHSDWAGRSR